MFISLWRKKGISGIPLVGSHTISNSQLLSQPQMKGRSSSSPNSSGVMVYLILGIGCSLVVLTTVFFLPSSTSSLASIGSTHSKSSKNVNTVKGVNDNSLELHSVSTSDNSNYKKGVPPFWLVVNMKFENEEKAKIFENEFAKLASYVKSNEADTTLSYQLAKSDKGPFTYLVFERYTDKEKAYLNVHRSSMEFKSFKSKLLELEPIINGESYIQMDDDFGFL